jgi:mono/diheme cytochrome c family protein
MTFALGLMTAATVVAADNIPAAAVTEGDQVWTTRCSLCHGAAGKGDGPASGPLNPKPRDMTDKKWQASVDDAHIEKVIVKGGAAVNLSPMMAANPDLESKPDVVKALRAKVRSLGAK